QIDADSVDQLYAIFRRGDALYVTTNASPPRASFSIEPAHGEAPLRVRFRDESTGGATGWLWDFGDGHTSTLQNPEHVFAATGEYTVTLTVSSPAGPSALTHTGKVLAVEPRHKVWIAPTRAFAGQREIRIPVLATTEVPLQGFQIAATFDATRLQIHRVDFEATNLAGLKPELTVFTQSNDPREPYVTVGVLIDVEPPFNRRVLPPGRSMRLVNLVADVLPSAPEGEVAMVELRHGTGRPAIDNIFVVQASSLVPSLPRTGGVLVDVFRFPPPRFFIRGDVDRNGEVALSDPIRILGHLFLGDPEPDCYDAADATDDGTLDLSDALFLLNFLFRGGIYPPPPGPDPGLDPTPDRFPDCPLRF
ncbi:MAG TPA: PKD domain-containing protein, partial [Planctomycetota bacterium]|nr:PKD domain-containing protein [Planctomycetota bacterium]